MKLVSSGKTYFPKDSTEIFIVKLVFPVFVIVNFSWLACPFVTFVAISVGLTVNPSSTDGVIVPPPPPPPPSSASADGGSSPGVIPPTLISPSELPQLIPKISALIKIQLDKINTPIKKS